MVNGRKVWANVYEKKNKGKKVGHASGEGKTVGCQVSMREGNRLRAIKIAVKKAGNGESTVKIRGG